MLEHKGIEHRVTISRPGSIPLLVRLAGFSGHTVPVLKIDGRRVETSLAIARELDRLKPDPALYPADAERTRAGRGGGALGRGGAPAAAPADVPLGARPSSAGRASGSPGYERLPAAGTPGADDHVRSCGASRRPSARPRSASARTSPSCRPSSTASDELVGRGHALARAAERGDLPDRARRSARSASSRSSSRSWPAVPCGDIAHSVLPDYPQAPGRAAGRRGSRLALDLDVADVVALDDRAPSSECRRRSARRT